MDNGPNSLDWAWSKLSSKSEETFNSGQPKTTSNFHIYCNLKSNAAKETNVRITIANKKSQMFRLSLLR